MKFLFNKGERVGLFKISWGISIFIWIIFYLSRRDTILNESEELNESEDRESTD